MANTKRLVRIVALIEIDAPSEADVGVIGGNLARQLQGAIPTQYDVRGVEVESITDPEADATETKNTVRARDDKPKTLTT